MGSLKLINKVTSGIRIMFLNNYNNIKIVTIHQISFQSNIYPTFIHVTLTLMLVGVTLTLMVVDVTLTLMVVDVTITPW